MYDLLRHRETDERKIRELINQYPLALISGCSNDHQPVAAQLPLLWNSLDGQNFLIGHCMKSTDHYRAFVENPEVLAVFTGPECYVSGRWYSNPQTPSTWNYMSVYVRGQISFVSDQELIKIMHETTRHFENQDKDSPTVFKNLPKSLTDRLLPLIGGFRIKVDSIKAVFKLSQDRDLESYQNIVSQLQHQGEQEKAIAAAMQQRLEGVFREN